MSKMRTLATALVRAGNEAIARWVAPDSVAMAEVAVSIERRSAALANRRQLQSFERKLFEAISRFRRNPDAEFDFRTLRLVCHGCCHEIRDGNYVLVADPRALPVLLGCVAGYAHNARRFRRLYHGLLQSYLTTDRKLAWFGKEAARLGNEQLRQFLEACFDGLRSLEPPLPWTQALVDHSEILTHRPTDRFVRLWHSGNQDAFRDVVDRLGIGGSSWLVAATINDVVDAAAKQDDATFVAQIPAFLEVVCEPRFQSLRDDILVALVRRYAQIADPVVHPALRDALIDAWKNPWLERNQSAWGRVPDAARKMVSGWLKRDLIHQFFEVLSEDAGQDHRRFEFWINYHEEMDDVYFALGPRSFHSRHPDLVKLRRKLDGRLVELIGSTANVNAFVMCLGNTVAVEFSTTGNAAFLYPREQLRIKPTCEPVLLSDLKLADGERLIHRDTGNGEWENAFAERLQSKVNRRQLVATQSRKGVFQSQASKTAFGSGKRPSSARHVRNRPVHAQTIDQFASERGINIDDKRPLGGSLWLRIDNADPDISKTLTEWGFKYATRKGWWRTGK